MTAEPDYPPPSRHDAPEEIFPGVFLVRGSMQTSALMRFNRTMLVVREGDQLTVLNSVRLTPQGEAELDRLGTVRHVIRLGYYHGRDDRYYADRYGAEFWAPDGSRTEPGPVADRVFATGGELPLANAEAYVLAAARGPEAVILLRDHRLLVTCDSLQYYPDRRFCSLLARVAMPLMGFPLRRVIIGPLWLKAMTPEGGSLESDFDNILALDFDNLVPGHGALRRHDAKDSVRDAVAAVYGGTS